MPTTLVAQTNHILVVQSPIKLTVQRPIQVKGTKTKFMVDRSIEKGGTKTNRKRRYKEIKIRHTKPCIKQTLRIDKSHYVVTVH